MTGKKLVAYFSASGVTRRVAENLARVVGADLHEIRPQTPYSPADLDWTNDKSRSSVEMADPSSRPALAPDALDLAPYDEVFVGFPIWWYVAPTIIDTFFEAHDFSGKRVALFATSGSSGMGRTQEVLEPLAPAAQWVGARRFDEDVSVRELGAWAESLGM